MTIKKITKLIVVDADGEIVTAANGLVSSDNRELVRLIKKEAKIGTSVQLVPPFGREVTASLDPEDLVGITAALFSARPGRTRLLEAPAEVWDWLEEDHDNAEGDSFPDMTSAEEARAMFEAVENFRDTEERSVRLLLGLDENDNDNKGDKEVNV